MKPPRAVQIATGVLTTLMGLALVALVFVAPILYPSMAHYLRPFAIAWALLALIGVTTLTLAAASLWWGKKWAQLTLLIASGLASAAILWASLNEEGTLPFILISGSIFGLTWLAQNTKWRAENVPRWAPIHLAILATSALAASWLILAFPVTSLYTSADGATLQQDAAAGGVIGLALTLFAAARLRAASQAGASIARWAVGAVVTATILTLLLIVQAERLVVATVDMDVVEGEEGMLVAIGSALVVSAIAASVWILKTRLDASEARVAGAALALSVGAALLASSAFLLSAAPRLVVAAEARKHTPGFEVVMLAVVVLVALAKKRVASP